MGLNRFRLVSIGSNMAMEKSLYIHEEKEPKALHDTFGSDAAALPPHYFGTEERVQKIHRALYGAI